MSGGPYDLRNPGGRRIFLGLSAVIVVTVILAAHEVMLPFVLAIVVAYVLTPGVVRVERLGVPRWAAISSSVYAVSLGLLGGSISLMMPRLLVEGKNAAAELPHLSVVAHEQWLPAIDAKLSHWSGQPVLVDPPPDADATPDRVAPMHITKRPDGSFDVLITEGVQVREVRDGVWHIQENDRAVRGISSAGSPPQGVRQSQRLHAVELARAPEDRAGDHPRHLARHLQPLHDADARGLHDPHAREAPHLLSRAALAPRRARLVRSLSSGASTAASPAWCAARLIICFLNGVLSAFRVLALRSEVLAHPRHGGVDHVARPHLRIDHESRSRRVAIGLTQSPGTAFAVLAWILGIHQLGSEFL